MTDKVHPLPTVQALDTDVVTEKSNHNCVGMAVSVCTTPAAPSPLPMPYPTTGSMSEGSIDSAMRTKIDGAPIVTVGSCMKACHGNEPGTLKEVVSLNTGGPSFPIMGAPTVLIELGMAAITGSPGQTLRTLTQCHRGACLHGSPASARGKAAHVRYSPIAAFVRNVALFPIVLAHGVRALAS